MNFGRGIALALAFFMTFIGYLAYRAFQENVDLVAENYYEQEVAYQSTIDDSKRTKDLAGKIDVVTAGENVVITFPSDFENVELEGNAKFICPSDKQNDVELNFKTENDNVLVLKKTSFRTGPYRMQLRWKDKQNNFYHEQLIVI